MEISLKRLLPKICTASTSIKNLLSTGNFPGTILPKSRFENSKPLSHDEARSHNKSKRRKKIRRSRSYQLGGRPMVKTKRTLLSSFIFGDVKNVKRARGRIVASALFVGLPACRRKRRQYNVASKR
jgi:hypothetical protein